MIGATGGWFFLTAENADAPEMTEHEEVMEHEMEATDESMSDEMEVTTTATEDEETVTTQPKEGDVKVFTVTGANFAFNMSEIIVQAGDTVTINFESTDGFHNWVIDEFDAGTEQVRPGTPTSVTFVADKAGTYQYYCSVGNHRTQGMVGNLIVQ